jgi:heme exporter protein D
MTGFYIGLAVGLLIPLSIVIALRILRKKAKISDRERDQAINELKDERKTLKEINEKIQKNPKINANSVHDLINKLP